jgi:hypothetical protein
MKTLLFFLLLIGITIIGINTKQITELQKCLDHHIKIDSLNQIRFDNLLEHYKTCSFISADEITHDKNGYLKLKKVTHVSY